MVHRIEYYVGTHYDVLERISRMEKSENPNLICFVNLTKAV